ncbi:MAG: general secretion pathway protein GspE [Campylobacteraceae bacterium 4484_4]|nr:MAG: general secretion pathway protein GspE [Campylobacteraceae bacterium 4484_4]
MQFGSIPTYENLDLYPELIEGVDPDLAVKNWLLITKIGDQPTIILSQEHLSDGFNYLSKLDLDLPIAFVDHDSYERLYHRYLELKTDKELSSTINEEREEELIEEDISLAEFLKTTSDILTSEESAPIIKFVNSLFYQAVKKGASDIHIETHETRGVVRLRIDGVLIKHVDLDKNIINLVISRIKVISNLDISEKRIPQDGRTQVKIAGRGLDIRVSVLPTYYGERVVMRILMESSEIPTLQQLGFSKELTYDFEKLLEHAHGMILVTGPTGSGKSTTLHTFLQTVATPDKNIITIEDPVEYKADNINQIQVNTKTGLTFAAGLRSILRQDPDIVMVGEIRDRETAEIAIQAALTGHLMLSTLHTNNTAAAITRLVDMGIDEFLISSSLLGVLAQRLVRKLCPHCKEPDSVPPEIVSEFDVPPDAKIYKAKGCAKCNYTGFIGRQAVGELLIMDDAVKMMLKEGLSDFEIRSAMQKKGMKLIHEQLLDLLLAGETSLKEVIRVGLKD